MNGIEPDDGVNRVQVALAPALQLRQKLVGNSVEGTIGEVDIVEVFEVLTDALLAVPVGVERDDFALQIVSQMSLIFLDELGFEGAGTISWGV